MPFCSSCGNQLKDADVFCGRCGTAQPGARPKPVDFLAKISARTFSILCYVPGVGWVPSVIVLALDRFRGNFTMRFHAFQGLYIAVAWLMESWVIGPLFRALPHNPFQVDEVLKGLLVVLGIFMMVKTSHGETYSLPIIGELALRSAEEK